MAGFFSADGWFFFSQKTSHSKASLRGPLGTYAGLFSADLFLPAAQVPGDILSS